MYKRQREVAGGYTMERTYVYLWPFHVDEWQKKNHNTVK